MIIIKLTDRCKNYTVNFCPVMNALTADHSAVDAEDSEQ
jgi:hypothetical protein